MSGIQQKSLRFPSAISRKDFIHFALFDTFRVKKRWRAPVLYMCIMSVSALICLSMRRTREQALMLATVLFCVGFILPAVWFLWYFASVRNKAKALALTKDKVTYTLFLEEAGIRIIHGKEKAECSWETMHMAWRVKGCIYLYVHPVKAFLLPDREESDEAWQLICSHLPEGKRKDLLRC